MKKNKLYGLMILIISIMLVFVFTACGDESDDSNNNNGGGTDIASFAGTWNASGGRSIVFTGSNFNYKVNGTTQYSGTFSVSGSTITFNESSLGTASGNFSLSETTLTLSKHTWDSSVNGTYTKDGGSSGGTTTITLARNTGETWDNWQALYDIPSSVTGSKITAGDVYTFTYSFKSNVAITGSLRIALVDDFEDWKVLSDSKTVKTGIQANTTVSGTINLIADDTAAGANKLQFVIHPASDAAGEPTLTFTVFSLVKSGDASGVTTMTLARNTGDSYDDWDYLYNIPSSVTGGKITAGDVYTLTYSFTSNVNITGKLEIDIVDNSETAETQWWTLLSETEELTGISANKTVSGSITLTATGTASSTTANANRLHFVVDPYTDAAGEPTLTFTVFSLVKGGTPPISSFAGTWNASGGRSIVFTGSNFNYKVNGTTQYSGTFSVSGSTITFNESSLGTASGNFSLSGNTLTLSNHTWDSSVNGTYTKDGGTGGGGDPGRNVYVAGVYRESSSTTNLACYWKNGTRTGLSSGDSANAITVVGSDVYVAGSSGYWKNGTKVTLTASAPGISYSNPTADDITVIGSDVYLAGVSGYWKNGTFSKLPAPNDSDGLYARAKAITVVGSDVYVAGSYGVDKEGGSSTNYRACYWKNGTRTNLLTDLYSEANDIFVVGSDVYVTGNHTNTTTNSGGSIACYWKNGTKTDLTTDNSYSYAITVAGSDVYIAGASGVSGGSVLNACYWKNGVRTYLGDGFGTRAYGITVFGSDVYVAGYDDSNTGRTACYWKNGVKTELNGYQANAIVVVAE